MDKKQSSEPNTPNSDDFKTKKAWVSAPNSSEFEVLRKPYTIDEQIQDTHAEIYGTPIECVVRAQNTLGHTTDQYIQLIRGILSAVSSIVYSKFLRFRITKNKALMTPFIYVVAPTVLRLGSSGRIAKIIKNS